MLLLLHQNLKASYLREYVNKAIILSIILLLPACKQEKSQKKAAYNQAAFFTDSLQTSIDIGQARPQSHGMQAEIEAKLMDIPTLIGCSLIDSGSHFDDCDQLMVSWLCIQNEAQIKEFYLQEMERFGWLLGVQIQGVEHTVLFEKPKKVCIISIRPLIQSAKSSFTCLVHISVGNKEQEAL